jgi:hypothetical protein
MKPFSLCLTLACTLLAGCASAAGYDENSPGTKVPVGSTLTLSSSLTIPADRRSIYILGGRVVSFNDVNIYYPYCQFRLRHIASRPRTVRPDQFRVTHTKQWDEYSGRTTRLRFADARTGGGTAFGLGVRAGGDTGGPSIISQATILKLASEKQPEVDDMVCQQWGDQGQTPHLTIQQIRDTLAPLFQLQTKRPPSRP